MCGQWLAAAWAEHKRPFVGPKSGSVLRKYRIEDGYWLATQDGLIAILTGVCDCDDQTKVMPFEDSDGRFGLIHWLCRRVCSE